MSEYIPEGTKKPLNSQSRTIKSTQSTWEYLTTVWVTCTSQTSFWQQHFQICVFKFNKSYNNSAKIFAGFLFPQVLFWTAILFKEHNTWQHIKYHVYEQVE